MHGDGHDGGAAAGGRTLHVDALLRRLPPLHRDALRWYAARTGTVVPWPRGPVTFPSGTTHLASTPRGIFKPAWTVYALSVRQNLGSPYQDQIVRRADGSWSFAYVQEGFRAEDHERKATNRGLLAALADRVPVAVFKQVRTKPTSRYEVLGLALVAGFDGGFFFLEGARPDGVVRAPGPEAEFDRLAALREDVLAAARADAPDVVGPVLDRQRVFREIVRRRGQAAFRGQLLDAYGGVCAVSRYDAEPALEAAHVVPFAEDGPSSATNGLLLRADLHPPFDVGRLTVDPDALRAQLHPQLAATRYAPLHDTRLHLPDAPALRPDPRNLAAHAAWARRSF
ncbi:MAG: HNH endonuclease signature motif containing protein [Trueperaceae bacterium]|nr:HNH endonuclease signature motif containing protein [Trueperaceae bacterium]